MCLPLKQIASMHAVEHDSLEPVNLAKNVLPAQLQGSTGACELTIVILLAVPSD